MTTNQTIDGVPRELKPCPFCGGSADLKCTEGDYPDWFVQCTECHASVDVFGPGAVHHWNDRKLPASRPQGEPVALLSNGFTTLETGGGKYRIITQYKNRDDAWSDYTALCKAEQPAPVAVVIDDNVEFEKWWMSTPILRKQKIQIAQEAWFARANLSK